MSRADWLTLSHSLCETHIKSESERERKRETDRASKRENEIEKEKYWTHGGGGDHDTPQQQYQTITRALCITSKRTSLSHIMCLLNTTDNERMPIASLFLPLAKRSCAWDNFFEFLGLFFGFFPLGFTYRNQTQKRRRKKIQKENIRVNLCEFSSQMEKELALLRELSVFLFSIWSDGQTDGWSVLEHVYVLIDFIRLVFNFARLKWR